jgi:hypothetical protein
MQTGVVFFFTANTSLCTRLTRRPLIVFYIRFPKRSWFGFVKCIVPIFCNRRHFPTPLLRLEKVNGSLGVHWFLKLPPWALMHYCNERIQWLSSYVSLRRLVLIPEIACRTYLPVNVFHNLGTELKGMSRVVGLIQIEELWICRNTLWFFVKCSLFAIMWPTRNLYTQVDRSPFSNFDSCICTRPVVCWYKDATELISDWNPVSVLMREGCAGIRIGGPKFKKATVIGLPILLVDWG